MCNVIETHNNTYIHEVKVIKNKELTTSKNGHKEPVPICSCPVPAQMVLNTTVKLKVVC